jgi:hypothetical protein
MAVNNHAMYAWGALDSAIFMRNGWRKALFTAVYILSRSHRKSTVKDTIEFYKSAALGCVPVSR